MIGIMVRKFDGKIEITGFQLPGLSYFVKSALLSLTVAIYGNYIRGVFKHILYAYGNLDNIASHSNVKKR